MFLFTGGASAEVRVRLATLPMNSAAVESIETWPFVFSSALIGGDLACSQLGLLMGPYCSRGQRPHLRSQLSHNTAKYTQTHIFYFFNNILQVIATKV